MTQMNLFMKQTDPTDIENKYSYQRGNGVGEG